MKFQMNLKINVEKFLKLYKLFLKKRANCKDNDENASIEEQIFFSQNSELSSFSNENSIISQNRVLDKTNLIYVRKIIFDKIATILFLSDGTLEAIFKDKVKILISDNNDKIEILSQNNKVNVISVFSAFKTSNYTFTHRIKIIQKFLLINLKDKNNKVNNPDK